MHFLDIKPPVSGTKVHYTEPYTGKVENGIIQTYVPNENGVTEVFVVYASTCGKQWDKYQDFTAQRTRLENLSPGWKKVLNWDKDKLIQQALKANHFNYVD